MYKLEFTKKFIRKYQKLKKNDSSLKQKLSNTLKRLSKNPKSPLLKSHKVRSVTIGEAWSSSVNGDIRIIWRYSRKEVFVLDVIDIGGHSGKRKVYT